MNTNPRSFDVARIADHDMVESPHHESVWRFVRLSHHLDGDVSPLHFDPDSSRVVV